MNCPPISFLKAWGKFAGLYKIPTQNIEQLGDAINYLDDNAKSKGSDIIDVLQRVWWACQPTGLQASRRWVPPF
nr:phage tail tape measure protein [Escherichia coli]